MASKHKKGATGSVLSKSSFAESLHAIAHRFSRHTVFDDFLTLAMTSCTQDPGTGKSWYEDEYLATIAKYKDSDLRHEFPKAFACLVQEMENRYDAQEGNDVLGEFFEQHISNGRNGQYFTPFPVCTMMATMTLDRTTGKPPQRILDPTCGSGRMLIAVAKVCGPDNEYYGIDIDRVCVKMTALNLFLNGIFNSEIMCANALFPDDFVIAYKISFLPFGIFKIEKKEDSRLWHLQKNSFEKKTTGTSLEITLDQTPFEVRKKDDSVQLELFDL
ncbi:MAG: N-6 DNA methylase [Chitinophagaceae bacterium]